MLIEDAYIARVAERAATDAAFKLATKGPEPEAVANGRREAVWCARPDGVVELVRPHWGRVELLEVLDDGTSLLVDIAPLDQEDRHDHLPVRSLCVVRGRRSRTDVRARRRLRCSARVGVLVVPALVPPAEEVTRATVGPVAIRL